MLNRMLLIGRLFDIYGELLTKKQQDCIRMHYLEDLSLAEIADCFIITRQAVHDILVRAEQSLTEYEAKLGFLKHHDQETALLKQVRHKLELLAVPLEQQAQLREIQTLLGTWNSLEKG